MPNARGAETLLNAKCPGAGTLLNAKCPCRDTIKCQMPGGGTLLNAKRLVPETHLVSNARGLPGWGGGGLLAAGIDSHVRYDHDHF